MTTANPPSNSPPTCYQHPDRESYVRCTRCDRYICGECMRDATVGQQCVQCVRAGAHATPPARTRFGGRLRSGAPLLTYVLIAVNSAVFVLQAASPTMEGHLTLWPPAVADGELYRLVTSAFLHYGLTHLLLNMWALYVMGPPLEMSLGRLRFGALYGLSALGGSVVAYLLSPLDTATAGASGAVFGLFGAAFIVLRRLNLDVRWVALVIAVNLVFTLVAPAVSSTAISWQGHLGGLITGTTVAAAYVYAPRLRRNLIQAGVTGAAVLLFAALIWWRTEYLRTELGAHFLLR